MRASHPVLHRGTQQIRAAQASNHPPILWRLETLSHETSRERPSFSMQIDSDEPSFRLRVAVEQAGLQSIEVVNWILDEVIATSAPRHCESLRLCLVER